MDLSNHLVYALIYLAYLCVAFSSVRGQDVTLTASPSDSIVLGSTITLTCSFAVDETNFDSAHFFDNDIPIFNASESATKEEGIDFGLTLSDGSENSEVWVSFKASFCADRSLERTYECKVYDKNGEYGSNSAQAKFAEASRILEIKGQEVCGNGSTTHTFKPDILGESLSIKFSTLHEKDDVTGLEFFINEKSFEPFSQEDDPDLCSEGALVGGFYKFTKIDEPYEVKYTVKTANGDSTGGCTIYVLEEGAKIGAVQQPTDAVSTVEPTTEAAGNGTILGEPVRLYGSTIALIIAIITLAILGLIGLWYLYLVKEGRADPPPIIKY